MRTTAVVIGAGHSGLAMSQRLTERSVEHVVIDRGDVADSWSTKRWPGLRLLTPNWMLGLPGQPVGQRELDGFSTAPEVADLVRSYARRVAAPVRSHTTVRSVRRGCRTYDVRTDDGTWHAHAVVLATGANSVPVVPRVADALPRFVTQCTAFDYRGPDSISDGGVLVVGASATGVQLAGELRRAGLPVTLAVGEHVRLPRSYRGRDIFWWLHSTGVLAERHDQVDDLARARRLPSPQLTGSAAPVDLASLVAAGVRLVGRPAAVDDGIARFSGSLRNAIALADLKTAWRSTWPPLTFGPWCGRPVSGPTTRGSISPFSTGGAASAAMAASCPTPQASTRSGSRCFAPGHRPTSMGLQPTPRHSPTTWWPASVVEESRGAARRALDGPVLR